MLFHVAYIEKYFSNNCQQILSNLSSFAVHSLTFNVPVVYMGRDVWIWMGEKSIKRGVWRGWPWNWDFFGPWNGKEHSECHLGPKKSRFQGPPLQTPQEMDFPNPNPYVQPYINNRYIGNFMDKRQEISGPIQRWFLIRGWEVWGGESKGWRGGRVGSWRGRLRGVEADNAPVPVPKRSVMIHKAPLPPSLPPEIPSEFITYPSTTPHPPPHPYRTI